MSLLRDLEAAASIDQADWLVFRIRTDDTHLTIEGVVYEGHRFVARATLAGKPYGDPFGVDVGVGHVLTEGPDVVQGSDMPSFVGAERPRFRSIRAPHTLPRSCMRTRSLARARIRA